MLDTIHGQNLSLQVHPLTEYIQDTFNMRYTQDESYYILDTEGEEGAVWLGVKPGVDPAEAGAALREAQAGGQPFDAAKYINCFPVKKHDHVLIPAGTVHGSGAGTMVLEISATPYIFTFKLWDWGRVDLDGKPRPIHIDHGLANIQWDRDTAFCQANLLHQDKTVQDGPDGSVVRTGLAEREFIDTLPPDHPHRAGGPAGRQRPHAEPGGGQRGPHHQPHRRFCPLYGTLRPDLYPAGGRRRLPAGIPRRSDRPRHPGPRARMTPCTITAAPGRAAENSAARLFLPAARPVCQRGGGGV